MKYLALVFVLSLPLWVLGGVYPRELLPGVPLSALMVLCPAAAALILAWRERGRAGVVGLARRVLDFSRVRRARWYAPTLLMMPLIAVAAYGVMRVLGREVPQLQVPWAAVPGMSLMILVAAVAEELGWSGYATPRMQERMTVLQTGLVLGLATALWHLVPLLEVGRTPEWAAWQAGNLVAARVLLVWLYNATGGSVAATALCHATVNLSWQLFPNQGSHYDPRIVGLITALVAVVAFAIWGPETLNRHRRGLERAS
ncbi:MAG: CPBP family intramembrane metalloprotease [Gemmatimonadota bacterium]